MPSPRKAVFSIVRALPRGMIDLVNLLPTWFRGVTYMVTFFLAVPRATIDSVTLFLALSRGQMAMVALMLALPRAVMDVAT